MHVLGADNHVVYENMAAVTRMSTTLLAQYRIFYYKFNKHVHLSIHVDWV